MLLSFISVLELGSSQLAKCSYIHNQLLLFTIYWFGGFNFAISGFLTCEKKFWINIFHLYYKNKKRLRLVRYIIWNIFELWKMVLLSLKTIGCSEVHRQPLIKTCIIYSFFSIKVIHSHRRNIGKTKKHNRNHP